MRRPGPGPVLAVLPPAVVLAVDPGGLAPFGPLKWLVLPTLALAAVALLRPRLVRGPALAWLVLLAVVALAAAAGIEPVHAWIGTPERRFGAVTWLLAALLFVAGQSLDGDDGRRIVGGAAVAIGLAGAWAGAEALGWTPLDLVGAGHRPVATLGSSAYLGAAAALLGPAAAGLAAAARGRARWLATLAAALAGVALVVAGARAAWVGAAVAAVVVAATRPGARRALAAGAVAAVALALVAGVAGRAPDALTDGDGGAAGRLDEWRVAARVVADHPLLGTGPEGYRIAFGAAVDDAYEQAHGRDPLPDRAHDALLDVAATTGIPGLLAYLAVVLLTGRLVLRALRAEPWLAGAAAGLVAYATQSLFLFPLAELDPLAWLLAGVVVGRVATTAPIRLPRAARVVAGALATVTLVAGGLDVVADRRAGDGDPTAADLRPDVLRYRLAAARAEEAVGSSIALDRALAQLDHALDVSRRDPVAGAERARLLLRRAERSGSIAHARTARRALEALVDRDPRNASLLLRLGVARSLTGDDGGAVRAWRAAERLAPRSAAASTNLALAHERAGRLDAARDAARRALARDPDGPEAEHLRRLAGT